MLQQQQRGLQLLSLTNPPPLLQKQPLLQNFAHLSTSAYAHFSYLKSAAVPMWAVYQFLVSVVLLRILIVMMTITYRRIYDDLDRQWK